MSHNTFFHEWLGESQHSLLNVFCLVGGEFTALQSYNQKLSYIIYILFKKKIHNSSLEHGPTLKSRLRSFLCSGRDSLEYKGALQISWIRVDEKTLVGKPKRLNEIDKKTKCCGRMERITLKEDCPHIIHIWKKEWIPIAPLSQQGFTNSFAHSFFALS